jgi:hypothetical protein
MKLIFKALAVVSCVGLSACNVDQTKKGEMPDVDVTANGGQMPEYDVDAPEVKVGTENKTVQVPTVDVESAKDDSKK